MSAVLTALAGTYPADSSTSPKFLSIDAEELPEPAEEFDVGAVPHVIFYKNGEALDWLSGTDAKKVRDGVEKYAGGPGTVTDAAFKLPPAQNVTRPAEGLEPTPAPTTAPAASTTNGSQNGATKDLSSYTPAAEEKAEPVDKEKLFERLGNLVKAAPVMLFMKGTPSAPKCGFSRQLVGQLRDHSVRYGFFNILADDDVRNGLKEFSDWPTFPQLYVEGELVGGLDIVSVMHSDWCQYSLPQVREEFENNPEFLGDYSVKGANKAADDVKVEA
jgi:Grx4 family monothiol glutaredoxin